MSKIVGVRVPPSAPPQKNSFEIILFSDSGNRHIAGSARELRSGFAIVSLREASSEAAMANHWHHIHRGPADDMHTAGLEEAAYVAGWILSCATVAGVILLIWQFNI